MKKTSALKTAQSEHGSIYKRSATDYVFTAPHDYGKRARTEVQSQSYAQALSKRCDRVVCTALHYMGFDSEQIEYAVHHAWDTKGGATAKLDYCLKLLAR